MRRTKMPPSRTDDEESGVYVRGGNGLCANFYTQHTTHALYAVKNIAIRPRYLFEKKNADLVGQSILLICENNLKNAFLKYNFQ